MKTIAQQVIYGLLVELIIVLLTVWLKDKPKAAISILAIGTLIATIVAFSSFKFQSNIDNHIPLTPAAT